MDINTNLLTKGKSLGNIYYWVLTAFFVLAFGMVLIFSLIRGVPNTWGSIGESNTLRLFIFTAILFFLFLIAWRFASPKIEKTTPFKFKIWLGVPLLTVTFLAFFFAMLFRQDLSIDYPLDVGACHLHAMDLANGVKRPAPWNHYFVWYDTNTFSMVFLYWAYRASFLMTGSVNPVAGSILNAVLLCCAVYATVYIGFLLRGRSGAFFTSVLSALFAPYYLMLSIPYTDSFSLPFACGGLALYLYAIKTMHRVKTPVALLGSFLILALGCLMKGNIVIILIALCIHLLIYMRKIKWYWRFLAVMVAIILLLCSTAFFRFAVQKTQIVDYTDYDTLHIPWSHWVMMGLTNIGGFNQESYEYTGSFATVEEKEQAIKEKTAAYLQAYADDIPWFFRWFTEKNQFSWAHGDYDSIKLVTASPLNKMMTTETFWGVARDYMQALHLLFFLNLFAFCAYSIRKKTISSFMLITLSVFSGMFVFLCLWEANPRYSFNLSFLLLLGFVWMLPKWNSLIHCVFSTPKRKPGQKL